MGGEEHMNKDLEKIYRKLFETVGRLEMKYNEEVTEAGEIIEIMSENNNNTTEIQKGLAALQRLNDKLFTQHGISDEIIDFQVAINQARNFYDLPDEKEITTHESDGEFVQ